jgi:hypothetical protein
LGVAEHISYTVYLEYVRRDGLITGIQADTMSA